MSCVVLIGGIIGCGKTTFINYWKGNEDAIFNNFSCGQNTDYLKQNKNSKLCTIIFDELCSLDEQANMMNSLKGWRSFRADLLMAAEHFINKLYQSKNPELGPLSERSSMLFEKLLRINDFPSNDSDVIFLVEDNFYYRSMRYEWFQLAKRANIGFCEIFLKCDVDVAISRNNFRGYNIPDSKIKSMMAFMEYPEASKYKWEKYSVIFDSTEMLQMSSLKPVIDCIEEATKNPAEMIMMAEKIEAQAICSKNIVHQADNILRKLISKSISNIKNKCQNLQNVIAELIEVRQNLLRSIKQGYITFPEQLLENLKSNGIENIKTDFENVVIQLFKEEWNKRIFDNQSLLKEECSQDAEIILSLKNLTLD